MNLKSKFMEKSDKINADTKTFSTYLDLEKFNLEKWKFEKKEKDYLFDILPYKTETNLHPDHPDNGGTGEAYNLPIYVHSYVGINDNSYLCMKKMYGKHCSVCEEFERRKKEFETDGILTPKEVWKEIKDLAVKYRILYHIRYKDKNYIFDSPYGPEYSKKISFSFEKSWKKALERHTAKGKDLFPVYLNIEGCTSLEFTYIPTDDTFFEFANFEFPEIKDYNKDYAKDLVSLERLLIIPDQEQIKRELSGIEDDEEQENSYYEDVVENEPEQETEIEEKPNKRTAEDNICPYKDIEKESGKVIKFGIDWDTEPYCDKCEVKYSENYENCKKIYKEG